VLKLADQPLQIILAVTEDEAEHILDVVRAENVHVFYTRFPIEFGIIGDDVSPKPPKHFSLYGRSPR